MPKLHVQRRLLLEGSDLSLLLRPDGLRVCDAPANGGFVTGHVRDVLHARNDLVHPHDGFRGRPTCLFEEIVH